MSSDTFRGTVKKLLSSSDLCRHHSITIYEQWGRRRLLKVHKWKLALLQTFYDCLKRNLFNGVFFKSYYVKKLQPCHKSLYEYININLIRGYFSYSKINPSSVESWVGKSNPNVSIFNLIINANKNWRTWMMPNKWKLAQLQN